MREREGEGEEERKRDKVVFLISEHAHVTLAVPVLEFHW